MLMALVPLFDDNMAVRAYSLFTQKNNFLLNPLLSGTAQNDGASRVIGLEVLSEIGIDTLAEGAEVFVPVTNMSVFSDIAEQCEAPNNRVVLLFDNTVPPVPMYIERLQELKKQGFKLGIRKLAVSEFENYAPILKLVDYVMLNNRKIAIDKAKIYFGKLYPRIQLCAGNIDSMEVYEELKKTGGYSLYEGRFYRVPVTKGQTQVTPMKHSYIQLLNMVNDSNFELTRAADVIAKDMALTLSLLQMVNKMARNSEITSIRHAAAMLGQKELRKWINTAVAHALYSDKPNEITRVSLLRAKFAENLSGAFELAVKKDELFLMGLFSVLDIILEKPMEKALEMVQVSAKIKEALIHGSGEFGQVLDFVLHYENADWQEVTRLMLLQNIDMEVVTKAYMDSMHWYRELTISSK